jgi:hypothetical protein
VVTAGYSGYSRLQWLQQVTVVTAGYSGYSRLQWLQQVTVVTAGYSRLHYFSLSFYYNFYKKLYPVSFFYVLFWELICQVTVVTAGYSGYSRLQQVTLF